MSEVAVEQPKQSSNDVQERASKAASLSRTLETRPDLKEKFTLAFEWAENNGKAGIPLNADLYGQYSQVSLTGDSNGYESRFTSERTKKRAESIIDKLYSKVKEEGNSLSIDTLGEFYDEINLNEPMLDSNKRTSILAVTHILNQFGYQAPDFSNTSKNRLADLQNEYPGNKKAAAIAFLRESLPTIPPSRETAKAA